MTVNLKRLSPTSWVYVLLHLILVIVGFFMTTLCNVIMKGVGSSLIAAGIAGWVILVYVRMSQDVSERVKIVTEFGFRAAFEGRSVRIKSEYDERLLHVSKQIDILGFGLKTLRQDYRNSFETWKHRANVRILLIDPHFPLSGNAYAYQRDLEEQDEPGTIKDDVEAFLTELGTLVDSTGSRTFEIRLYRCLPSLNLFRVDDDLFWGPYLINQQSRNSPTFVVRKGPLFDMLTAHFDTIWTSNELSCSIAEYRAASVSE